MTVLTWAKYRSRALRSVDTGARFGGDEFAILLHGIDADGALLGRPACPGRARGDHRRPRGHDPGHAPLRPRVLAPGPARPRPGKPAPARSHRGAPHPGDHRGRHHAPLGAGPTPHAPDARRRPAAARRPLRHRIQLAGLQEIGCTTGQGLLFTPAVPGGDAPDLLDQVLGSEPDDADAAVLPVP